MLQCTVDHTKARSRWLLNLRKKFVYALVLSLGLSATAQTPAVIGPLSHIQAPSGAHRIPEKQTYVYTAEWRLWTAGTITLRVENAGNRRHVIGTADSAGVVALLYRVHDRFESWFDTHTFCSQQVNKHIEEGLRRKESNIRFDYPRRRALLNETDLKKNQSKYAEEEIPGCVTDVLSGVYYVGSLPLQNGSTYIFPVNDGGKTVDVRANVEGREQVKTEAGTFSTIRVGGEANAGPLKDRGRAWVWYTDDAQHLPVQMRARLFWGTLTLKLQRVERQ